MLNDVVALKDVVALNGRIINSIWINKNFLATKTSGFDLCVSVSSSLHLFYIYITVIMHCAGCYRDRLSTLMVSRCTSKGGSYRKTLPKGSLKTNYRSKQDVPEIEETNFHRLIFGNFKCDDYYCVFSENIDFEVNRDSLEFDVLREARWVLNKVRGILHIFNGGKLNGETIVTAYCRGIDAAGLIIRNDRCTNR